MRTTIELPDELLQAAKVSAASAGVSLRTFFLEAVQQKLAPAQKKTRMPPPQINGPRMGVLTTEQLEDAMFGPLPE